MLHGRASGVGGSQSQNEAPAEFPSSKRRVLNVSTTEDP